MTSLSTQQKLSMSLDDISDFEKSENKSTFELNVTEPLKNDILELPIMSPPLPAIAYQKHIRALSDPSPHIYLNYMALLFGGQILKKHYPTSSSVYQFPDITQARSYFRTFVPTDLSPDYISEVRKGFQFQLSIIKEISQRIP